MNFLLGIGYINRKTGHRQLEYVEQMRIYSTVEDTKRMILAIFATIRTDAGYQ
jgi:hypothetical protein